MKVSAADVALLAASQSLDVNWTDDEVDAETADARGQESVWEEE